MKHHKSVFENEQDLLKALIQIHLDGKDIECDPMYFKGNFYKDGVNRPKYIYDLNPQVDYCPKGDAEKLIEYLPNFISSIILDPPFLFGIHGKTKDYYSSKTHTIYKDLDALITSYKHLIGQAWVAIRPKGTLIFKCQDYTDSKTTMTHILVHDLAVKEGFYAKDLAILVKPNKITNPHTTQRHLRKIHTYFWVFKKI